MSAQFGSWNFDGRPVDQDYLQKVLPIIAPYGPDRRGSYSGPNISVEYCALHITNESRREKQTYVTDAGTVITWDGRLDNREELRSLLQEGLTINSTDVAIAAAAFSKWGTNCFAKL